MSATKFDPGRLGARLAGQFRHLDGRHPGLWPAAPRALCAAGVALSVMAAGYAAYCGGQIDAREAGARAESQLRQDYRLKSGQARELAPLRAHKAQLGRHVEQLRKQLPRKAEMAALLTDINQAGAARGLQFELFKPAQAVPREHYAELPIELRVGGRYHDIGAFAADLANLPRVVTLHNMVLAVGKDGVLTLQAVLKTFRQLDAEEARAQRKAAADRKKAEKKP